MPVTKAWHDKYIIYVDTQSKQTPQQICKAVFTFTAEPCIFQMQCKNQTGTMLKYIYIGRLMFFSSYARHSFMALALAGLCLFTYTPGQCEESAAPIHIEADRMVSQEQNNSVVFIGNVDASQGKVTIRSDEMTVYYTQKDKAKAKSGSSQVKKLVCRGNVEITQDDWLGTGKRMDYFAKDRKVILTGDARAWQGQNMVSGKTIIYYLDDKRSIVKQDTSKPGRVTAVIHPDDDAKKK